MAARRPPCRTLRSPASARAFRTVTHSFQPLAMSVSVRVWTNSPSVLLPPQCSTMSISQNPGGGSSQSAKLRTGMLRRIAEPTPLRRLRCPSMCARAVAKTRSMVAALTSKPLVLMTGSRSRWPCRSMASTNIGINGFRRLPHTRSAASHNTVNAWATASSYTRLRRRTSVAGANSPRSTRIACLRWWQVKATNSSRILVRSLNAALRYRSRSASLNSLRVVMLICLVTLRCPRRTIRRVATYVRQQVSIGRSSDESMRQ